MLVLLVACGYPSYYPNPGTLDLYVDTGVAANAAPPGPWWHGTEERMHLEPELVR